ncbi:MAG: glycosyltransferase family 2 protein [Thermoanaerobaculia bacterium]
MNPTPAVRRITVFFPVYNEGRSAGNLLRRLDEECRRLPPPYRVLVVDDGSTDESVAEIRRQGSGVPLVLLEHGRNRGLQEALKTGIEWVAAHCDPDELVIFMDGDDTHDPAHIRPMLDRVEAGADVVVASRFRRGSRIHGVPRHRQLLSFGANLWGMLFFHLPGIRDYACGYRAVRAQVLQALVARYGDRVLELPRYGFICSVEILVKLGDVTRRFAEVPMVLRYDRKESLSKMNALRTTLGYFALFFHRLRRSKGRD